jgi:hypothetical protein
VTNTTSQNRRSIRLIFFALGVVFILIAIAPIVDNLRFDDGRALLRAHDWSNPEFSGVVSTVVYMTMFALIFLTCVVVLKNAGAIGLSVVASINAILLVGACFDAKSLILAFPLGLSLIGLMVEIYRAIKPPSRTLA